MRIIPVIFALTAPLFASVLELTPELNRPTATVPRSLVSKFDGLERDQCEALLVPIHPGPFLLISPAR